MAMRLFSQTICNSKHMTFRATMTIQCRKRNHHTQKIPITEFQIPVQWGHIAAKLWGEDQGRPILALHGWQDNAGSWDTLAPLLCQNRSILAIDLPGHGLSSWIPPGMQYFSCWFPPVIYYIKEYFKWDKISILGHSMGSIAGLKFSCLFPDDVDFFVGIDSIIDEYNLGQDIEKYPDLLRKMQIIQSRLTEQPPSYTLEEIKKLWHLGTRKSVDLESVKYLLHRGAKQSKKDPNKYFISRDPRIKYDLSYSEDKQFLTSILKRSKCPTLYFKALDPPFFATSKFAVETRELIEKNNDKYEIHFLPGTHHIHLNNPQALAPIIIKFLEKYNINI